MISREVYMQKIRPFIDTDLVKVITGIRRSGKSVMMELVKLELFQKGIEKNQIISINFEDIKFSNLLDYKKLNEEILAISKNVNKKLYLFFDEIQEVDNWEKCVNSFRVSIDCDIYLTGSNAKLLSGELATYLAGRYIEIEIYPFSFSEFVELYKTSVCKNDNKEKVELNFSAQKLFNEYINFGGMPYLSNLRYEVLPCRQYLLDLFNSVQLKDVIKRNKVRDADLLERILLYIMENSGTTFSANSISKYLKNEKRVVAPETVTNYLKYCIDAFLIYQAKREDVCGKQIFTTNEKYYIADHGIRAAIFGENFKNINLVLENIVYLELLRRDYNVTIGKAGTKEIDFICSKNGKKIYIQVCYLLAGPETVEREFSAFESVKDNFPKYVLSLDEFDMSQNGIIHKNIRDWLLEN